MPAKPGAGCAQAAGGSRKQAAAWLPMNTAALRPPRPGLLQAGRLARAPQGPLQLSAAVLQAGAARVAAAT